MCVFIVLNLESTLCQVVQLLKVFKLWCEGGISLDTGTKLYLESTEALPKEPRVEESQRKGIENSYKDALTWEIIQSRITRSNNVASIGLTTTELRNVANNVSIVNKPDKERTESFEVIKNETCSFKMEKRKMPKFSGDVREYAILQARN